MNEEMLMWMNRTYPNGFSCMELTNIPVSQAPLEALTMLDAPILLHINVSQLQDLVSSLIERGTSPSASCYVPRENVSATLGDVVLKIRGLGLTDLFLVIAE